MIQENLQNKLINEYGEELTKTIFEGSLTLVQNIPQKESIANVSPVR